MRESAILIVILMIVLRLASISKNIDEDSSKGVGTNVVEILRLVC